jgi:hypothetical protein
MAGGISRTEAAALFTEGFTASVLKATSVASVALSTIPTFPMSSKVHKQPVLSALPTARFLTSVGEVKPLSTAAWDNVFVTAEEIAVIVPIDDSVIADAAINVVSDVQDAIAQAFAVTIDAAVFFGTGAPASWPAGGIAAKAADVEYADGDSWGAAFDAVESLGADVSDVWASRSARGLWRTARSGTGNDSRIPEVSVSDVWGITPTFPLGWDKDAALAIVGDDNAARIGIRQDLTFSISDQANLTGYGSLWEKDATAIRAVMRIGFALANPISVWSGARSYPFAKVVPAPAGP